MTAKQKIFVQEYLVDLSATAAAKRAGFSAKTAREQGYQMLKVPEIASAIDEAIKVREQRIQTTQDDVLKEIIAIALADAQDLVEHRRVCCRYCWGIDFKYQRTSAEMAKAKVDYEKQKPGAVSFDEQGGEGYNATFDPNPECPECFGIGKSEVFIKDSRDIPAATKSLLAGFKVTRDGVDIRTHDKVAALTLWGRHLGMFKDQIEHSGAVKTDGISDEERARRVAAILDTARTRGTGQSTKGSS